MHLCRMKKWLTSIVECRAILEYKRESNFRGFLYTMTRSRVLKGEIIYYSCRWLQIYYPSKEGSAMI